MANATNAFAATITSTDSTSNVPVNRGLGTPTLAGSMGQFAQQAVTGNAGIDTVVSFPPGYATVYNIYIKNNAAVGSGQKITIKWTPQGGAEVTICTLDPGSFICYWNIINTADGITTLKVNGSANQTPYEIFMGA